jgi:hypothetical protein
MRAGVSAKNDSWSISSSEIPNRSINNKTVELQMITITKEHQAI